MCVYARALTFTAAFLGGEAMHSVRGRMDGSMWICLQTGRGQGKKSGMQTVYYIGLVCISAMVAEQYLMFCTFSRRAVPSVCRSWWWRGMWTGARFHDSGAALWLHGGGNTFVCMHAGEDATGLVVRRARERLLDCWTQPRQFPRGTSTTSRNCGYLLPRDDSCLHLFQ